ncbi:MAG: prolyl oligopeptidase family serine peptidase [Deltaproteobacteria bacterium]|nr:prolyl oligopeptidase family serine peptidase [Deltaproteobacteria bacterium]
MRRWAAAGSVCLLALATGAAAAAALPDGTLLEASACPPNPLRTYEQYVAGQEAAYEAEVAEARQEGFSLRVPADLRRHLLTREDFRRRRAYAGFECLRIRYQSDGLSVAGFLWKPKATKGRKYPLIIFNRGGRGEYGTLTPWRQFGFYEYLANGFVVIASQYRGAGGGEGRDEFGGADVRDVLNLVPLARSLGYIDMKNLFMLGASRGGMMTYLALKQGAPVNAVAVVGGLTDLVAAARSRPSVVSEIYEPFIPGFRERGEEALRERSVVFWADKINVPVLLLHGGEDWRSKALDQVLAFARRLEELEKTYELVIYAGDDHGLTFHRDERDKRIIEWFREYRN